MRGIDSKACLLVLQHVCHHQVPQSKVYVEGGSWFSSRGHNLVRYANCQTCSGCRCTRKNDRPISSFNRTLSTVDLFKNIYAHDTAPDFVVSSHHVKETNLSTHTHEAFGIPPVVILGMHIFHQFRIVCNK